MAKGPEQCRRERGASGGPQGLRSTIGCSGDPVNFDYRLPHRGSGREGAADGMIFGQDSHTPSRTTPMTRDPDAMPLPKAPASILEHFARLPDPRREQGQIHRLDEIV